MTIKNTFGQSFQNRQIDVKNNPLKPFDGSINNESNEEERVVLKTDGVWGIKTTKLMQEELNLEPTGKILTQPSSIRGMTRGADTGWQWVPVTKSAPDKTIMAIQIALGVDRPSGIMDAPTIRLLASLVGDHSGDKLDSDLVSKIQKCLVDGDLFD